MTSLTFIQSSLIGCLTALKNHAAAEPLLSAQYEEATRKFGVTDPHAIVAARKLHNLYTAWNKLTEAAHYAHTATAATSPDP